MSRRTFCQLVLAVAATFTLLSACGSDANTARTNDRSSTTSSTIDPTEDLVMEAGDFVNLADMTPVRGFFVANPLGHLDETLAVANDPKGGDYPVGTVIQLVPQEAMVKRRAGFSPETGDWEFFFLTTDSTGTKIEVRGSTEVVNRFGGNCFACHALAEDRFDLVCEQDHGCEPLPIGRDVIEVIQQADLRPRKAAS